MGAVGGPQPISAGAGWVLVQSMCLPFLRTGEDLEDGPGLAVDQGTLTSLAMWGTVYFRILWSLPSVALSMGWEGPASLCPQAR